jgi:hypothetical protein
MKIRGHLFGGDSYLSKIKMRTDVKGKAFRIALRRAGLDILRLARQRVPVDTGNLKRNANVTAIGKGWNTTVLIAFHQEYAMWVHESVGMVLQGQKRKPLTGPNKRKGRYWDPKGKGQAKFLESAYRDLLPEIRVSIRAAMKA